MVFTTGHILCVSDYIILLICDINEGVTMLQSNGTITAVGEESMKPIVTLVITRWNQNPGE
jgi:hypothetical protein